MWLSIICHVDFDNTDNSEAFISWSKVEDIYFVNLNYLEKQNDRTTKDVLFFRLSTRIQSV